MTALQSSARTGEYIDAGGLHTYYEVYGAGDSLVLLHGGLCTVETLDAMRVAFAQQYKVYLFERRGHGRTPDVDGPITYKNMAADTVAFLDALGLRADLVDLKSPYLAGHSRGVANLVEAAAQVSGLSEHEVTAVRRAGLIHDLGRLGVSNAVWDKPGPLTAAEFERARLHPYLTDRMLARVPALAHSREIAARHHERLDGSGYPGGLTAASLGPSDRLLAAADVYHALTEPRPHRPALDPAGAADQLRAQGRAGLLDGEAINAVLRAAGRPAPTRRGWPAGLTAREVEVLGLLARGHPNKQIALRLGVTPKTVANHVEHIYTKIAVSSRAAATLYASRHGLLGTFESL
jgi:HD-GYP domain-containing protein (c-di-GMP phosphodiesterase class II)/DNA-binding CsgD family transcriptional regulator